MNAQKQNNTSQPSAKTTTNKSRKNRARFFAKKRKKQATKVQKPRVPQKQYISGCCSVPARKPRAGEKFSFTDPETHKVKEDRRGLGKWRCTGCNKVCKVRPQAVETAPVGQ